MYQQNSNLAERKLIPEYSQFDIGAFVYSKKTFDKITISGGLRTDYRNTIGKGFMQYGISRFTAFNKNFGNISGSIGLSYSPNDEVTWKFNLARGYRAPNVSELASNGAHEGTNRYEYGDNNLKSETTLQLDAGFEINRDHISFALNGFFNNIQNFIFY